MSARPIVQGFYDPRTNSIQYVASCPETKKCAIIDPVLDFDPKAGAVATIHADAMLDYVKQNGLTVEWILDTHPHADHFSAARYLKEKTGAPNRDWRKGRGSAEALVGHVQLAKRNCRRLAVGQAVCRRRNVHHRKHSRARAVFTGTYACVYHPRRWRRRVCSRHAVPARWRDSSC